LGLHFLGPWGGLAAGLLAMLGHSYNPLFGFKPSGKGVAAGLGIVVVLLHREAALAVLVFVGVVMLRRYVSLGSMLASLVLLVAVFVWREPLPYLLFSVLAVALLFLRHRANIDRLRRGEEPKIF
jgi:glycerol-3-phosphate acyltransferase PlsY